MATVPSTLPYGAIVAILLAGGCSQPHKPPPLVDSHEELVKYVDQRVFIVGTMNLDKAGPTICIADGVVLINVGQSGKWGQVSGAAVVSGVLRKSEMMDWEFALEGATLEAGQRE